MFKKRSQVPPPPPTPSHEDPRRTSPSLKQQEGTHAAGPPPGRGFPPPRPPSLSETTALPPLGLRRRPDPSPPPLPAASRSLWGGVTSPPARAPSGPRSVSMRRRRMKMRRRRRERASPPLPRSLPPQPEAGYLKLGEVLTARRSGGRRHIRKAEGRGGGQSKRGGGMTRTARRWAGRGLLEGGRPFLPHTRDGAAPSRPGCPTPAARAAFTASPLSNPGAGAGRDAGPAVTLRGAGEGLGNAAGAGGRAMWGRAGE